MSGTLNPTETPAHVQEAVHAFYADTGDDALKVITDYARTAINADPSLLDCVAADAPSDYNYNGVASIGTERGRQYRSGAALVITFADPGGPYGYYAEVVTDAIWTDDGTVKRQGMTYVGIDDE